MAEPKVYPDDMFKTFHRISMYTPTPGVEGRRARLQWGMRDDMPRITVNTNDPSDKTMNGVIYAGIDPISFEIFLDKFENVIKSQSENKDKVDCYGSRTMPDNTKEKFTISEIWFGKDKDGVIWISLIAPERPRAVFKFGLSEWHGFYNTDGSKVTDAQGSVLSATCTLRILRDAYHGLYGAEFNNMSYRQKEYREMFRNKAEKKASAAKPAPASNQQWSTTGTNNNDDFGDIQF